MRLREVLGPLDDKGFLVTDWVAGAHYRIASSKAHSAAAASLISSVANQRSASSAAMHPMAAAVTA